MFQKHEIPLCAIPCLQYRRALEAKNAAAAKESAIARDSKDSQNSGEINKCLIQLFT